MKADNSLEQVYLSDLQDLYDAEKQLVKALPKLARSVSSPKLSQGFERHAKQTQEHAKRLEKVFQQHRFKSKGRHCPAMAGLIAEAAVEQVRPEPPAIMTKFAAGPKNATARPQQSEAPPEAARPDSCASIFRGIPANERSSTFPGMIGSINLTRRTFSSFIRTAPKMAKKAASSSSSASRKEPKRQPQGNRSQTLCCIAYPFKIGSGSGIPRNGVPPGWQPPAERFPELANGN